MKEKDRLKVKEVGVEEERQVEQGLKEEWEELHDEDGIGTAEVRYGAGGAT